MFEHLDDPAGFAPDMELHRVAVGRGRRMRRTRHLVIATAAVVVAALSVGVAGALYVERRDAAIDRVDVITQPSLDGATNVLLVGTDARPELEGSRADTIAVVRVEADGSVRVLSIPRDLVDPQTGERMASASATGRQALLDAVDRVAGIPIDHYVELDLAGFVAVVDQLGGLRLAVDAPLVDERSGLHLPASSCATLDGETALALVRARSVAGDTGGDIGRMARAQAVVTAAVAQLVGLDPSPGELDRFSRILADHATVDDGLTVGRMVELGRAVAGGPGVVRSVTMPVVEDQSTGGGTLLAGPDARSVLQEFGARSDEPPADGATGAGGIPVPTDVSTGIRPC